MYKGKKILGIIPARGGSKGIPSKNIIEIYGKPLIQYSIECGSCVRNNVRSIFSIYGGVYKKL